MAIKNPNNNPSYVDKYDIDALADLANMAKAYVRSEEDGSPAPHSVPNGSYSDLDCNIWQLFANCVRYGIDIANGKA